MQKCYNCGKEVDDNVLICPECGALVKRYGKPEPQQAEPFESQGTAFTQPPQPHAAVWQREDGKLKFSGGVTFWLVLCAIFLGYTLLGFACTLFIYRFQAAYFQTISQFQELAPLAELLRAARPGTLALGGMLSAEAKAIAAEAGVELVDYFAREELTIRNAIPTAEGCIGILMAERSRTLWGSSILLTGFGPVGQALGVRLGALGAQVTAAARRPAQRALAESFGLRSVAIGRLGQLAPAFDTVVNTVPALVLSAEVLARLRPESLIVDLASRPGGTDFEAARRLGHRAIHALSLPAACAPETAGEAVAQTVCEMIGQREEA